MPERNSNIADWFYVPSWEQAPLPSTANDSGSAARNLFALIFLDESGCGSRLVELLQNSGRRATAVRTGTTFQQINENSFVINPEVKENYLRLWKELTASGSIPDTIVHLWCLTRGERGLSPEDSCEFVRSRGFNSLLYLTQSIGDQASAEPLQLKVVSDDLHRVTGKEILSPSKAVGAIDRTCTFAPGQYRQFDFARRRRLSHHRRTRRDWTRIGGVSGPIGARQACPHFAEPAARQRTMAGMAQCA